jgi:hypothetical protein
MDRHAQVEAFVPAQAVPPADIGQAGQPAGTPTFGLPRWDRRGVQSCIEPPATVQEVHQVQEARHNSLMVTAPQAIELGARRQRGESRAQVALCRAVERPFAWEAGPLLKEAEGDHRTPAE